MEWCVCVEGGGGKNGRSVLLQQVCSVTIGVVLCVTLLAWVSAHHRVSRFHC